MGIDAAVSRTGASSTEKLMLILPLDEKSIVMCLNDLKTENDSAA